MIRVSLEALSEYLDYSPYRTVSNTHSAKRILGMLSFGVLSSTINVLELHEQQSQVTVFVLCKITWTVWRAIRQQIG